MVSFRDVIPETLAMGEFTGGKLYVDTELTPEIEAEGYTREIDPPHPGHEKRHEPERRGQDQGRSVYVGDDRVKSLVTGMKGLIMSEVRADSLDIKAEKNVSGALVKDWDVEGMPMAIGIEKI